jgi:hypothetical protein
LSISRQRIAFFPPSANAAIHRDHVRVSHLLQIVGSERGAEPTTAIENHFRIELGHALFDVTLDHAFAQMNRAGQVILGKFAFFPDIDQEKFLLAI